MLTNKRRRELLDNVRASGYPGSISEVFQAASQGRDLIREFEVQQNQQQEQQMQVAQTQQEQETGLRDQHAQGNTQASMAFPDVQPNQSFNTVGMKAPIDIQKIDNQGHLVESYKNVPPGIQDLPTGPAEGTIIESPAAYQTGGVKEIGDNIGVDIKTGRLLNLDIQKSYEQRRGRFDPGYIHDWDHYKKWKKDQEKTDVRLVQKGGYKQKYQGGGFDFPDPNVNLSTQIQEQEKIVQANKSEADIQFENVVYAHAKTNNISIAQAKADLIKDRPGHTTYSADTSKTTAITDAYTEAMQEKDPTLSYTEANTQAIRQRKNEINQQFKDAGKLALATAAPLAIGTAATTSAGYAGLSTLNTLGRGAVNWGWRNLGGKYYGSRVGQGINTFRSSSAVRPMAKGLFKSGYNALKFSALPSFYGHTGKFAKDIVTGDYNNLQDRTLDFGRGVVSLHPGLQKHKDIYKISQDAWQGNYADVLARTLALGSKSPGIGKGMEYYGTKLAGKFLPDDWQNLGGVPSIQSIMTNSKRFMGTRPMKLTAK